MGGWVAGSGVVVVGCWQGALADANTALNNQHSSLI